MMTLKFSVLDVYNIMPMTDHHDNLVMFAACELVAEYFWCVVATAAFVVIAASVGMSAVRASLGAHVTGGRSILP